jgi:hypothetical protein
MDFSERSKQQQKTDKTFNEQRHEDMSDAGSIQQVSCT